ncbi:DsbE family thiol:disulfide interchange protein [Labrys monachus]|uniref:Cytochrome c biogenesis protein CcmG/thiol:disulfide interchange protein DsbE n=1 Tax=Labrys monachus TaxID=217067 RepID=A0ABU0FNL3_9HYPH|nr:DsbE family thiol:disulfide interchange protein [Labrys monachus]MDQ0396199.1 cytochrome c biogenesis protein CcmG/thiol:disulfide interchange protein DsbE [Labrys monachus]
MSETQALPVRPRRRWLAFLPIAVFAALALLFWRQLGAGDPSTLPSALIGKTVPDMKLPPLDGLQRDGRPVPGLGTADLEAGGVTVVNVFASWCGPCQDEHPVLMRLAAQKKVRIAAINYKDLPDNARRFLGTFGDPYDAVGVDANGRSAIDWGVYGVPETFLVGKDGVILDKIVGPLSDDVVAGRLLPAIEAAAKK